MSVSSSEVQGDGASSNAMISADGRYVVFTSNATNLVAGDVNGVADVFVRDLATGATDRITDGNAASGDVPSSISADGTFVTFASSASNLVAGDSDGVRDVFLWSRSTGGTRLITPGGASAIAADGAAIAVGGGSDIVLVDRATGSSTPLGAGSGAVLTPGAVAAGGSRVVFRDDRGAGGGRHQRAEQRLRLVAGRRPASVARCVRPGQQRLVRRLGFGERPVCGLRLPGDNLDAADHGTDRDVFVRDLAAGETRLVSTSSSLTQISMSSSLSADASSVAFASTAADLVAGDTTRAGGGWDAFRFDSPFQLTSDTAAPPSPAPPPTGPGTRPM